MKTALVVAGLNRLSRIVFLAFPVLLASCGGGGGGSAAEGGGAGAAVLVPIEQETIRGQVFDGYIANAIVCIDLNQSGRCDEGEPQTRSDAAGGYQLGIPKNSTAPLIAEVVAGQSREAAQPGTTVDVSYRMASPSRTYSTNITPFTTLVHLSHEGNFPLAEDLVRNVLGLPPHFTIKIDSAPSAGTVTKSVVSAVVTALQALSTTLDLSGAGTMDQVVAKLPRSLTDLPVLRINTKNAAPIVSKETYIDATFSLTNPAVSMEPMPLNGKIRGRGHSTWGWPKNPYKIQFTNDASYAKISDVLGMPKSRRWELLADYFDRSLIRNKLAFSLGASSVFSDGMKWNPSGQHLEVYLNEDYVGVYLLTQGIRIDPDRLNLKQMSTDPKVNDVDGGYIVEVDFRLDCYNQGDLNLQLITPQGVPICINTPDESAITATQLSYIKNLLASVEKDLYGANRIDRINLASFVDWYLLNELFRTIDAPFWSSIYMWKDTDAAANPLDRLLNLGPIWDFDLSAGNVNFLDGWKTEGCWVSKAVVDRPVLVGLANGISGNNWLAKLSENPEFVNLTIARWKQKRPALATFINASVDAYSRRLGAAQQRNFTRWPVFGVPLTNYYTFASYPEEVVFVKHFLNERMAWLDKAYASPESFNALCR